MGEILHASFECICRFSAGASSTVSENRLILTVDDYAVFEAEVDKDSEEFHFEFS